MKRSYTLLLALTAATCLAASAAYAAPETDDAKTSPTMQDQPTGDPAGPTPGHADPMATDEPAPKSDTGADTGEMGDASEPGYVVKEGDTLAEIAEKELGSSERWQQIARANDIDDPKQLKIGQKLRIPSDSTSSSKARL